MPHGPASKDTISKWLKQVMFDAGLDTSIFKPHSTRSTHRRDHIPPSTIFVPLLFLLYHAYAPYFYVQLPKGPSKTELEVT